MCNQTICFCVGTMPFMWLNVENVCIIYFILWEHLPVHNSEQMHKYWAGVGFCGIFWKFLFRIVAYDATFFFRETPAAEGGRRILPALMRTFGNIQTSPVTGRKLQADQKKQTSEEQS